MTSHGRIAALALVALTLAGCSSEADTTSHNLSKDADNFKIERRITFINGITDKYLLVVEGRCSIVDDGGQLEVTCKTGENEYKKHFLGLSDNVTYVAEQIEGANVDAYHYKLIFRPETIVPDVDVMTSGD
ncbi:MAG: hypothetical protein EON57_17675 [Alphaproteobacteria bacterium]|nr:MAG: hypothetical protein EON57_17675 [Alphaproteobacteria bacterium]